MIRHKGISEIGVIIVLVLIGVVVALNDRPRPVWRGMHCTGGARQIVIGSQPVGCQRGGNF